MASSKKTVLIVGATGYTGRTIAQSLAQTGNYSIKAVVRASSLQKPNIKDLQSIGVKIVTGDIVSNTPEQLDDLLKDVDILISTVLVFVDQKPLLLAAKRAGVKRVIPSDFGPHIPKGVTGMQDTKLDIREFIISNGIPYTFIQVGWWIEFMFPRPHGLAGSPLPQTGKEFIGQGDEKNAWIAFDRIGEFVRRIIADQRTLNATVQAYDGETTLSETWERGAKLSGEEYSDYPRLDAAEVERRMPLNSLNTAHYEYARALYIRGDNTVEKAIAAGALDFRKLYPDYVPKSLEEAAKEFYENPPVFSYDLPSIQF